MHPPPSPDPAEADPEASSDLDIIPQDSAAAPPAPYTRPALSNLKVSATLAINEKSAKLIAEGRKIYRLGFGQSPFPVPEVLVESLQDHAHEKNYLPVQGLPKLRSAIAASLARDGLPQFSEKDVIIGPGSKELLYLMQLCFSGDMLVASPCWVSYVPQAMIAGKRCVVIHTQLEDNWHLTASMLEQATEFCGSDAKLLILNSPGNPGGTMYSATELEALAEVCRERNIVVLSDEIYAKVAYDAEHVSMAEVYPEGTIISSGISKWAGAGGWRLGFLAIPEQLDLMRTMAKVASETFSCVSAPIQHAAADIYGKEHPEIADYLFHSRRVLRAVSNFCQSELSLSGVGIPLARGGFYTFPDFSLYRKSLARHGVFTGEQLCDDLLEKAGVAALPGSEFNRPKEDLSMRLAFVDFDGKAALDGSRSVSCDKPLTDDFVREYCGNIVGAMDSIRTYLHDL